MKAPIAVFLLLAFVVIGAVYHVEIFLPVQRELQKGIVDKENFNFIVANANSTPPTAEKEKEASGRTLIRPPIRKDTYVDPEYPESGHLIEVTPVDAEILEDTYGDPEAGHLVEISPVDAGVVEEVRQPIKKPPIANDETAKERSTPDEPIKVPQDVDATNRSQQPTNHYVVIASTIDSFARKEDYDYLVPLTARNWNKKQFTPIVIMVGQDSEKMDLVRKLWEIILPKESIVVPILLPQDYPISPITVAQTVRHYGASLVPVLSDESFLRLTDADTMILSKKPFLAPSRKYANTSEDATADIDIFNGACCLQEQVHKGCVQYPIHSVGMKIGLWRQLFPLNSTSTTSNLDAAVLSAIREHIRWLFGERNKGATQHGGRVWRADQFVLGCTIADAVKAGNTLTLAPGPSWRLHIGNSVGHAAKKATDVHLAGFQLKRHDAWFHNFLNKTNAIGDVLDDKYPQYFEAWTKHFGSTK